MKKLLFFLVVVLGNLAVANNSYAQFHSDLDADDQQEEVVVEDTDNDQYADDQADEDLLDEVDLYDLSGSGCIHWTTAKGTCRAHTGNRGTIFEYIFYSCDANSDAVTFGHCAAGTDDGVFNILEDLYIPEEEDCDGPESVGDTCTSVTGVAGIWDSDWMTAKPYRCNVANICEVDE